MTRPADGRFRVEPVEGPPLVHHVTETLANAYAFAAGFVAGQGPLGPGLRIVRDCRRGVRDRLDVLARRRRTRRAGAVREVPADTGVLFVDGVPRATLAELSALARSSGMSRSAAEQQETDVAAGCWRV